MATAAQKGNSFLLKLATTFNGTDYTTVAAMTANTLTINNTNVDITNKDAAGWVEAMPGGGAKSLAVTADGIYTDDATQNILKTAITASTLWACQLTDEASNTFTGDFHIDSLAFTGGVNEAETFSVSLTSSGTITLA